MEIDYCPKCGENKEEKICEHGNIERVCRQCALIYHLREVRKLEKQIIALEEENSKLKKQVEMYIRTSCQKDVQHIRELEAENNRLKKLVEMYGEERAEKKRKE